MTRRTTPAPKRAGTATDNQISAIARKLANIKAVNPEAFWAIYRVIDGVEKKSTKELTQAAE